MVTLNFNDFKIKTKIDIGSHEKYIAVYNKTKYVLKFAGNPSFACNEVLASKLYKLAKLDVPSLDLVYKSDDDTYWIASKFKKDFISCGYNKEQKRICKILETNPASIKNVLEGFIIDVWLANWDVYGLSRDNIGCINNNCKTATRIDLGGSLLYRARGEPKYGAFSSLPTEIDVFTSISSDNTAYYIFRHLKKEHLLKGIKKLVDISPEMIKEAIHPYSKCLHLDKRTNFPNLCKILQKRRNYLISILSNI